MSSIELATINGETGDSAVDTRTSTSAHEPQELLPYDRGYHAYSFLAAATLIEALVWGFPFSVGVLHEYWTSVKFRDSGQEGILTTAATLQSGLMYMAAIAQGP